MIIFKKVFSFFCSQLRQIQTKGPGILFSKVQKSGSMIFMGVVAPIVVYLKIDWPQAYYFLGNSCMKKCKKLSLRYTGTKRMLKEIERVEDKVILCMERYIACKPSLNEVLDWINASATLFHVSLHRNKNLEGLHKKIADSVHEIVRNHQLDELGIEFIPRGLAIGSIGTVENLIVYIKAGMLGLRPPKKLILLLDPGSIVNNPCYLGYWSQFVTIVSDPSLIEALSPLEKSLTAPINFYMSLNEKILSSPFALGMVREKWNREKRRPMLTISDEDYQRGWQHLKTLGVPQDAWFVCLHVRESGWKEKSSLSEGFRNSDINFFLPAVKDITDAGGWVIRMGDSSMTPLGEMENVVDYANSNIKSDWMDIFLCSQSRFFIGTSSGVFPIAMAFGIPIVVTNLLPAMAIYQMSSTDIFLPRICRSKIENRSLTFCELISPPFGRAFSQHYYDHLGVETVENTSDEIKDAVNEMLEQVNNTVKYSEEDEYLQERFKSLAASCGKLYGDEDIVVNARIGKKFLRKYTSLLPSDKKEKALY